MFAYMLRNVVVVQNRFANNIFLSCVLMIFRWAQIKLVSSYALIPESYRNATVVNFCLNYKFYFSRDIFHITEIREIHIFYKALLSHFSFTIG